MFIKPILSINQTHLLLQTLVQRNLRVFQSGPLASFLGGPDQKEHASIMVSRYKPTT